MKIYLKAAMFCKEEIEHCLIVYKLWKYSVPQFALLPIKNFLIIRVKSHKVKSWTADLLKTSYFHCLDGWISWLASTGLIVRNWCTHDQYKKKICTFGTLELLENCEIIDFSYT